MGDLATGLAGPDRRNGPSNWPDGQAYLGFSRASPRLCVTFCRHAPENCTQTQKPGARVGVVLSVGVIGCLDHACDAAESGCSLATLTSTGDELMRGESLLVGSVAIKSPSRHAC